MIRPENLSFCCSVVPLLCFLAVLSCCGPVVSVDTPSLCLVVLFPAAPLFCCSVFQLFCWCCFRCPRASFPLVLAGVSSIVRARVFQLSLLVFSVVRARVFQLSLLVFLLLYARVFFKLSLRRLAFI